MCIRKHPKGMSKGHENSKINEKYACQIQDNLRNTLQVSISLDVLANIPAI